MTHCSGATGIFWLQMFFPKNPNPLLAYPHQGGGEGGVIPLGAPRISKKAGTPPPGGEGIQATEKRLAAHAQQGPLMGSPAASLVCHLAQYPTF